MSSKYIILSIFLCLILFAFSCEKNIVKSITTIKYGTSFGMCIGYCRSDLTINNKNATFVKSKNTTQKDAITCINQLDEKILVAMLNDINLNSFMNLPEVIGCPDCADGGAEYVEITSGGKTKRVTYEFGKTPAQISDLVAKLKVEFKSFNNCK